MKILNSEIIMEIFNNIKEAYPNAEKIWYDPKEEKIFYKTDGIIQEINLRDLIHNDIRLASLIFEDLKDKAGTYYDEYVGTSKYEEKSYLKDDYEFLAKYIKLGLLFTYFIDEMLSGYDYMVLEDKYKSLEIDGTVCFEEGAYKILKEFVEERKRVHDFLKVEKL